MLWVPHLLKKGSMGDPMVFSQTGPGLRGLRGFGFRGSHGNARCGHVRTVCLLVLILLVSPASYEDYMQHL